MDLENKMFAIEKRGYSITEVDNYKKSVADEIEKLNVALKELTMQNEELIARNEDLKNREQAIKDVLLTAHKTAETMVSDAKDQANLIGAQAKIEYQRVYEEIEALKSGFAAYQQRLLDYVEDQKNWLLSFKDTAPVEISQDEQAV